MKKRTHTKAILYASQPSAGFPSPGDDLVEQALDINDLVIKNPTATFFVRVSGDSMEGAGIFNGDVLVVDRSLKVGQGSIVVAAIYGEMVVKRVHIEKEVLKLISEHDGYDPVIVTGNDDCLVWGTVVGSVRTFY